MKTARIGQGRNIFDFFPSGQGIDFLATGETTDGHYSLFHVFIPAGP
jgi:hypothetical protein